MTDLDNELAAAWDEAPPAVRDAIFRIAVLSRIERHRFRRRMAALLTTGFAAYVIAAALAPQLNSTVAGMSENSVLTLVGLAFVVSTGWGLSRAFRIKLR